jgi:mono/diheme cytochrome c family protein
MSHRIAIIALAAAGALGAKNIEADARRGAEFFAQNRCTDCHAPGGPRDLSRRLDRDYTPATLASRIWNHVPTMFAEMKKQGIAPPKMSEQQAADLFAFFYSRRYFERPGDAARGKRAFAEKGCAGCHGMSGSSTGPALSTWGTLADPVALVGAMWNHAPRMKAAIESKGGKWPELSPQDLADMLVYVQNRPGASRQSADFQLPTGDRGQALFTERCAGCHTGANSLANKLEDETLTDVAAAMWNHAPMMRQSAPEIPAEDMRQILGYAWATQFLHAHGNADRGKRIFDGRKCGSCHGTGGTGAPSLAGIDDTFGPIAMVSVAFSHGPKMQEVTDLKKMQWPALTPGEVVDLSAYLSPRGKKP